MNNPASICIGGGILLAVLGNPLGAAALIVIGVILQILWLAGRRR